MALILDGSSRDVALIWIDSGNNICLMHTTAVTTFQKNICFPFYVRIGFLELIPSNISKGSRKKKSFFLVALVSLTDDLYLRFSYGELKNMRLSVQTK